MRKRIYTDQQLIDAVKNNFSIGSVLKTLGVALAGSAYKTFYSRIENLNIDISHFTGQGHGIPHVAWNKKSAKNLFVEDSGKRLNHHQRKLIFQNKILGDCCSKCGLKNTWQDQPITLEIDHINGDPHDNRLENLRLLCPNCHSQTPTYRSKNWKINNEKNGKIFDQQKSNDKSNYKNDCIDCGKKVYRNSLRCGDCNRKFLSQLKY